ncbi:hypothetical protein G5I_07768 [Acromyrmex echinatior]|uniref:Uncharacterized protein n=1 Tax=Acromyrmex echinatior TaxID=103372 RepID=F4WPP8_ACREC|nr:hypothetical protein G5I_07768 [Acromyrmex echinatior]
MLLNGDRKKEIDHVYGVYLSKNYTMLGDKYFDVDTNDFVIVDGADSHKADNPIVGSKGYKYKNIIVRLVLGKTQIGTGMPRARNLNNKSGNRVGKGVTYHMDHTLEMIRYATILWHGTSTKHMIRDKKKPITNDEAVALADALELLSRRQGPFREATRILESRETWCTVMPCALTITRPMEIR